MIAIIDDTVCARPGDTGKPEQAAIIRMKDHMQFTFYGFLHFERAIELLQLQLALSASQATGGRFI